MAWIESHQSLLSHRKTLRAAALLKLNRYQLIGHLHALWWWAVDNVPESGCLGDVTDDEVAEAAGWSGRAPFAQALREAGFIDNDGLHNWWRYAGKLSARRAANADRMKAARAAHVSDTSSARAGATNSTDSTDSTDSTNSTNRPAAAAAAAREGDAFSRVCRVYEGSIGSLSKTIGDKLAEAVQEHGETCVAHCLEEAAASNARSWKYTAAIMARHGRDGCFPMAPAPNGRAPHGLSAEDYANRQRLHEAKIAGLEEPA